MHTSLLVASSLLHASALSVPFQSHLGREVAAAGPALPLLSDFQKDNVSASWAPGHPKVWGEAEKTFSAPDPPPALDVNGVFTEDGKFLLLSNRTDTDIISVDTGAVISTLKHQSPGEETHTSTSTAPDGQYDIFVAASNWTSEGMVEKVTQYRVSQEGVGVGSALDHPGFFINRFDPTILDADGNRLLVTVDVYDVRIYNLDDGNGTVVTLKGHTDTPISIHFSSDKQRIATTGFDGYVKVWDAATGTLVLDIPPEDPEIAPNNQNWLVRFSPDGQSLLYTIGSPAPDVKLVNLENPTDIVTVGPYDWVWWIRSAEWNSDGSLLALGGLGWLRILRSIDLTIVQEWRVNDAIYDPLEEVTYLHWFDNDTKLRWSFHNGTEMYDFEKNLKYRWGPGEDDEGPPDGWVLYARDWFPFKSKGWFGNFDSDSKMRVWSLPE